MNMRACKMGLSGVERSPQPPAARQAPFRWPYTRHGRPDDNGADLACSFASVVLPLFWKANLDRVQFSSSAENPPRRTNLLLHKSVTTEDLAVPGYLGNNGASKYDNDGKKSLRRRQEGHGLLTAVRSEGDLRCKYSAALSSARCSDAERLKRRSKINTDLTAVKASVCRDAEVKRISRRVERCRRAVCGPQHCTLGTGRNDYPQPPASVQRFSEENKVHSHNASIAEDVGSEGLESPTLAALLAPSPPQCLHRSTHSAPSAESSRKRSLGAGVLQQVAQSEGYTIQSENFSQCINSLASHSKTDAVSSAKQGRDAKTEPLVRKVVEELNRIEVEKAHNRMREHMADMLRFLDRIQAKHARRRTTAAFRLRAAKSCDGSGTLSYAALHCLTGFTGCASSKQESVLAGAATCGAAVAVTPEAAPLRRLAGGGTEVKDDNAAGVRKRSMVEETQRGGGKSATETIGHNAEARQAEKSAARESGNPAYAAARLKPNAAPESCDVDATLRNGEEGSAEAAAEQVCPVPSVASTASRKNVVDAQVSTESEHAQGTVAANDAKHSVAPGEVSLGKEILTADTVREESEKCDSSAAGTVTGVGETAQEPGAFKKMEGPLNTSEVSAGGKSKEGGYGNSLTYACSCPNLLPPLEGAAAPGKNIRHPSAAAEAGNERICADGDSDAGETTNPRSATTAVIENFLWVTETTTEDMEHLRPPRNSVHDRKQVVKCESTSFKEQQSRFCAAAVDQRVILFEKKRPPRNCEKVTLKDIERTADAAVSCAVVARVDSEKGSGRHASEEVVTARHGELGGARAESIQPANVYTVAVTKTREAVPEQQLQISLAVVHQGAKEDVDAEDGAEAKSLPTALQSGDASVADIDISEDEKACAELAQRDIKRQQRAQSVEKIDADGADETAAALQHHRKGLTERRTAGFEQHVLAAQGGQEVREAVKGEPSETARVERIRGKPYPMSPTERGGYADANIAERRYLADWEAAPVEQVQFRYVERKVCPDRIRELSIRNEGKPHGIERSRPAAEELSDMEARVAREHEAKIQSAKATECVTRSVGTQAAEVNGILRNTSSTRIPCQSPGAAADRALAFDALSSRCEAEVKREANEGAGPETERNRISDAAVQEMVKLESESPHRVIPNVGCLQMASTAQNARSPEHAKISGDCAVVCAPLLSPVSGSERVFETVEIQERNLEKRCSPGVDKDKNSVDKQEVDFISKENEFHRQDGACFELEGEFNQTVDVCLEGDYPKQPISTSRSKRFSLELHAKVPTESRYRPAGSPTQEDGVERAKETAQTSWCEHDAETRISRLISRATTVPSPFGTLQLSSEEDFFKGHEDFHLLRRETETLLFPNKFICKEAEEVPPATGPAPPMEITTARAAQKQAVTETKEETVARMATKMERSAAERDAAAAEDETGLGLKQVNSKILTEEIRKNTTEAVDTSVRFMSEICDPGSSGPQDLPGDTASSRSTRAGGASAARRAETGTAETASRFLSSVETDTSNDKAMSTAVSVCERCAGGTGEQLWPTFATPVPPFLGKRGRGGAYTTKDLSMLSGGYWYWNNGKCSFRLAPQPLRRRDPAYMASHAAGIRARAIQHNLLLSIQREVRMSGRRVRSMYYWPKSFVHACASAVLTKATMMAAGSLVAPLCHCARKSGGCGDCLPDTSLADAPALIYGLNSADSGGPPFGGAPAVSHPRCPSKGGEGRRCTCGANGLSLEKLALMDGFCWCDGSASCCFKSLAAAACTDEKQKQDGGSPARLGRQDGLHEEIALLQHSQHYNKQTLRVPLQNQKARRQGDETTRPDSLAHQGVQQSLSATASCSNRISPPALMKRHRPPLIALWSLTDAEIVEVAGTFSPAPWKDVYRMQWDRSLGGFALDLYSVAPRDMLLRQERFTGLRVDDRHKHILSRGWWVCPFYPTVKEEAVLQVAVKFRVDGVWRCEPMLPIHRDEQGRAVNLLVVYQGEHVTSPQLGQTQYFFKGLDLSPLTYNPSRSPAYQADGPVFMQPSAEDVELEEALMSHHRRCWNPPSSRPLMARFVPRGTGAAPLPCVTGAGGTQERKAGKEAEADAAIGALREEDKTGEYDAEQEAHDGEREAEEKNGTTSGVVRLQVPQTTSNGGQGTWKAGCAELEEQQQQCLVAGGGGEGFEQVPFTNPETRKSNGDGGGLGSRAALLSQQEGEGELFVKGESSQRQVCRRVGKRRVQVDENCVGGTLEQEGREDHKENETAFQQNRCAKREERGTEPSSVLSGEKGDGDCDKHVDAKARNHVEAETEAEYIWKQSEAEHNCLLLELEKPCFSDTSMRDLRAAPGPSRKRRVTADRWDHLPAATVEPVGMIPRSVPRFASKPNLSRGTHYAREKQTETGSKEREMECDNITSAKKEGTNKEASPSHVFNAEPRAEASSASEKLQLSTVPKTACSRRQRQDTVENKDLRNVAADQQAVVVVSADAGAVGASGGQRGNSLCALKDGKAASPASTPRLNRGFSAYGSTLGVAEEGSIRPAGKDDPPTQNAATGALRRVCTLGNSYWPSCVTKYLQTPDVFHDLSSLDVAGRRTPAEGARLKRGLTLQCGSYMIPHPDKTESGGADAFFIATPVPPSSRYSKRFASMDNPLARSSTPPLRSIPPSRQRGRYTQAETGIFNDRTGSIAHTWESLHSGDEYDGEAFATTRSSVVASFSSMSSCSFSWRNTSPSDSSTRNSGGLASSSPAESLLDTSTIRNFGTNGVTVPQVTAEEEEPPQHSPRQAASKAFAPEYDRESAATSTPWCEAAEAAQYSAEAREAAFSSHTVGVSAALSTKAGASAGFLLGGPASTQPAESSGVFEIGKKLPEDEASAVQMLLREALEENENSGLAQVLSGGPSQSHGSLSADVMEQSHDSGNRYSVNSSFICAGAAVCTPPRRPAGAPVMIAGGYGSSPKGVIIGSGGESGGAVCVGVADGVGEWDSFGLNPRLFAEELMRGCWEAAHEAWFWEMPAVEQRALEVLKRGYKAARSFGSCTALVACLDTRSEKIGIANLGDSGVIILRRQHQPRLIYNKMTCVHRSREQQHNFNCPYQLSRLPSPSQYQQLVDDGKHSLVRVLRSATMLPQDTPEMADVYTVNTLEGDLVLLGTDGLFDNLFDHEICALANAALSPYEAALLNNEGLATSADAVAAAVAEAAAHKSRDPLAKTPFMRHARRAQTHFVGGKMDDITVVACWVTRGQLPPDYLTDESERA